MPVYEYRCTACRKKSSVFVRTAASAAQPACAHCGGTKLVRLFSTFAVHRTDGSGADDFDDGGLGDIDESDPKAMARALRKAGGGMRDEMGPEFDEVLDQMERGEMPEDMSGDAGDGEGGDGLDGLGGGDGDDLAA